MAVSTASSLLHVPFSTEGETGIPAEDLKHFAFAVQKLDELKEVAALADATEDEKKASAALAANQALFDGTRVAADPAVAERIGKLSDADYVRQPAREERQALQREALGLPLLPTTTIGSFPQTKEIRAERAKLRKGEVTKEAYDEFIKAQIDAVIKKQEEIGLDVLVHGEFERNDMVEYFGQNLNGFLFTKNAWVQSYGTRCVKPPIVWGDVFPRQPDYRGMVRVRPVQDRPCDEGHAHRPGDHPQLVLAARGHHPRGADQAARPRHPRRSARSRGRRYQGHPDR